jgi:hypothetical protein
MPTRTLEFQWIDFFQANQIMAIWILNLKELKKKNIAGLNEARENLLRLQLLL